jgi:hypothetical protein
MYRPSEDNTSSRIPSSRDADQHPLGMLKPLLVFSFLVTARRADITSGVDCVYAAKI